MYVSISLMSVNINITIIYFFFFFNDTATTEIYTLSLHDALPILRGPVVRIDASTPESLEANKAKVKGAFVMLRPPSFVWNNDGPPMSAADTQRMRDQFRGAFGGPQTMDSAARARIQQYNTDQPFLLRNA